MRVHPPPPPPRIEGGVVLPDIPRAPSEQPLNTLLDALWGRRFFRFPGMIFPSFLILFEAIRV